MIKKISLIIILLMANHNVFANQTVIANHHNSTIQTVNNKDNKADNKTDNDKTVTDFQKTIDEQLKSDEYSIIKQERIWQLKESKKDTPSNSGFAVWQWLEDLARYLDSLVQGLAFVVKLLLMVGLVLFVWWLYRKRSVFAELFPTLFSTSTPSVEIARLAKEVAEPLADDDELTAQIGNAIASGNFVLALSLLYRSSLRAMSLDHDLPIKKSDTEGRCRALLAGARRHYQGELPFFDRLIDSWQTVAYGIAIPADIGERTRLLFADWQRIYGKRGASNE